MENKEFMQVGFECKASENDGEMMIEGYASTFANRDHGGDVVIEGAFADAVKGKLPKMLWQHRTDKLCGVWDEMKEDSNGLYVKGRFADTQLGREAYELAKLGAIESFSIGYSVSESEYVDNGETRLLQKLNLHEVSLVTFPMNEQARVVAVKSLPDNVRDFEQFLRDAGYSNQQAKNIASAGFKSANSSHRDDGLEALQSTFNQMIESTKGN